MHVAENRTKQNNNNTRRHYCSLKRNLKEDESKMKEKKCVYKIKTLVFL